VPFEINNNGVYQNYYLPIFPYLLGTLLKMRLELTYGDSPASQKEIKSMGNLFRESLTIDYIRIMRAPEIWRVRGCLDKYYNSANYQFPDYNITNVEEMINNHLPIYSFIENQLALQFATTYDCPISGKTLITIEGINFGPNAIVSIGKNKCEVLSNTYSAENGRFQTIICILPSQIFSNQSNLWQDVRVTNAAHQGLFHEVPSLHYRVAPPVPMRPNGFFLNVYYSF
jgi:hypothetical protein